MATASGAARIFALVIAACIAALAPPAAAQSLQPNATWTNQRGSSLTIRAIAADGSFTGTFVSHSGGCQNQPFPVSGWIDGEKIAFAVRWVNANEDCEAITSWTGFVGPKGALMRWVSVHFGHGGRPLLESGTDVFH